VEHPPLNLFDFEELAPDSLPVAALDRIAEWLPRAAVDRRTRHVLDAVMIRPRILSGVSKVVIERDVAGGRLGLPVVGGGSGCLDRSDSAAHRDVIAGARRAGTVQIVSSGWGTAVDHLASAGSLWLHVPVRGDGAEASTGFGRVAAHGYQALVLDLDCGDDGSAGWQVVEKARSAVEASLVVKGIVRGEDAARAVELGADAVVVSCLPRVPELLTAVDALAEVVEAVDGACDVHLAGGIRRGIDVFKVLAMGATACIIDRPIAYAHAVAGEEGVADLYGMLRSELTYAMETCGVPSLADLTRDLVAVPELARRPEDAR